VKKVYSLNEAPQKEVEDILEKMKDEGLLVFPQS
jgi:hypothetical protein